MMSKTKHHTNAAVTAIQPDPVEITSKEKEITDATCAEAVAVIEELRRKVKNLKCCGNCINLGRHIDMQLYCGVREEFNSSWSVCHNWQSDNLTKEEREI